MRRFAVGPVDLGDRTQNAVYQPPTFTLTRDVPTLPRPSTVSMLTTRVPTGGTPQPNFMKKGSVRETPADNDIEPGIGIGEELGIGTSMELVSGTDELRIDVPPNGAADVGINLDVDVVPSRSRK